MLAVTSTDKVFFPFPCLRSEFNGREIDFRSVTSQCSINTSQG